MGEKLIKLFGYQFSVYTRIVTLCLFEKELAFDYCEVDPFQSVTPESLRGLHPFGRVPVLVHECCKIYETSAITRYLDAKFPYPSLTPVEPVAVARMQQVIGIVDSYGYRALVRQVFSNLVFRPLEGLEVNLEEVRVGLQESRKVLDALEEISHEGKILNGESISLADFHLLPLVDYFCLVNEGDLLFKEYPSLCNWWTILARRRSTLKTKPDLTKVTSSA